MTSQTPLLRALDKTRGNNAPFRPLENDATRDTPDIVPRALGLCAKGKPCLWHVVPTKVIEDLIEAIGDLRSAVDPVEAMRPLSIRDHRQALVLITFADFAVLCNNDVSLVVPLDDPSMVRQLGFGAVRRETLAPGLACRITV